MQTEASSVERSTEQTVKNDFNTRVKAAILLDDFFMKKFGKEAQPRKTLHRALLDF
jgi:hypothetical protein